jgi:hypothetical protein
LEAIFLVLKAIDGTNGAAGDGPLISIAMVICAGTGLTPATLLWDWAELWAACADADDAFLRAVHLTVL